MVAKLQLSFFKVMRLLIISSVTILTVLTFLQMVSPPAYHGHLHLIRLGARYEKYKLYFLAYTCKCAKKTVIKEGENLVKFFRGVNRVMGINEHIFYSHNGSAISELIKVIPNILCSKSISTAPDITFSPGGCVHINHHQSLLPLRVEDGERKSGDFCSS
jgi:hypothetical protein